MSNPDPRPRPGNDAVVYDLDGTLVRLAVDWEATRDAVAEVYRGAGRDPDGASLWELLERADDADDADGTPEEGGRNGTGAGSDPGGGDGSLADRVEATIADRERAGARRSRRLPPADEVAVVAADRPVAVVSLNAESACRVALDEHGLADAVPVVVGRDTLSVHKPNPEPLLYALREVGVAPDRAVFVGDSGRDEETARRAGVAFEYVGDVGH